MTPVLLVTGTDTGVGKTVVAAGLAHALTRAGHRVVAVKPVETGCGAEVDPGEDGAVLAQATGQAEPRAALLRLRVPITPALAADRESATISFDEIVGRVAEYARGADLVIVEGAGGLLAPITWERNALDLARVLDAAVLVVAADRLGTINHALLTLRALEGHRVAGLVLSAPPEADDSTGTNADSIRRHASVVGIEIPAEIAYLPRVAGVAEASRYLDDLARCVMAQVRGGAARESGR